MKDEASRIGQGTGTDRERRNLLREYLQHVLLRALFDRRLLGALVFHGGTALRILHGLARFSEDLDFHTLHTAPTRPQREGRSGARFDLGNHLDGVRSAIERDGYRVEAKPRTGGTVQACMFRFPGLLFECGLSARPEEKLSVKIEVDRNPPSGFGTERRAVDRFLPFVVRHHDRPTFLAGKLHALLQRPFAKGRDYYDLMFYLQRWPEVEPNVEYLNAALQQTGYVETTVTTANWKALVAGRVRQTDWAAVKRDLAPFVLRAGDIDAFEKGLLLRLL